MSAGTQKRADEPIGELETVRYIADMTQEMSTLARSAKLETIAYLLEMVRLEAEETLQKNNAKLNKPG